MQGTVASVVPEQGYGYIAGDDGSQFFFHRNALKATDFGELAPGVRVEFEVQNETPGDRPREEPRAVNVHLTPNAIPAVDNEALPPEKTGQSPSRA